MLKFSRSLLAGLTSSKLHKCKLDLSRNLITASHKLESARAANVDLMQKLHIVLLPGSQTYTSTTDLSVQSTTLAGEPKCYPTSSSGHKIKTEVLAKWNHQPMILDTPCDWLWERF